MYWGSRRHLKEVVWWYESPASFSPSKGFSWEVARSQWNMIADHWHVFYLQCHLIYHVGNCVQKLPIDYVEPLPFAWRFWRFTSPNSARHLRHVPVSPTLTDTVEMNTHIALVPISLCQSSQIIIKQAIHATVVMSNEYSLVDDFDAFKFRFTTMK